MNSVKKYRVTIGDKVYEVEVEVKEPMEIKDSLLKFISRAKVVERRVERTTATRFTGNVIRAPISGKIVKVLVSEGDRVEKGSSIAVIESMKTHIEVMSNIEGLVKKVLVKEGDFVRTKQEIVVIERKTSTFSGGG